LLAAWQVFHLPKEQLEAGFNLPKPCLNRNKKLVAPDFTDAHIRVA